MKINELKNIQEENSSFDEIMAKRYENYELEKVRTLQEINAELQGF